MRPWPPPAPGGCARPGDTPAAAPRWPPECRDRRDLGYEAVDVSQPALRGSTRDRDLESPTGPAAQDSLRLSLCEHTHKVGGSARGRSRLDQRHYTAAPALLARGEISEFSPSQCLSRASRALLRRGS